MTNYGKNSVIKRLIPIKTLDLECNIFISNHL